MRAVLLAFFLTLAGCAPTWAEPAPKEKLLELLKQPGHIGFMRHAWAPFEGAPKSSPHSAEQLPARDGQRNLDAFGRSDAVRVGQVLRDAGVTFDVVYTSHVWRCTETAELMMRRPVENLPLINSYYADPDKARGPAQLKYLKQFLNQTLPPNARGLMVTHGSLISDLAKIDTGETEIVIVKADGKGDIIVIAHGTL
jgi:phosphohistidine phosphatase SixA